MKFLFLFPAMFCLSTAFSQNAPASSNPAPTELSTAVTKGKSPHVPTIQHCEYMIKAIDTKVAYVESDPAMREKAIATGWFEHMAKNRERYVATKKSLEENNTTR